MTWFESPQYMKAIQKIKSMSPEDKAVTQTLVNELHGLYADADMRKQLQAMRIAAADKQRDRNYELSRERLDLAGELGRGRQGMAEDAYDFQKGQNRTAENLGWGNIALSGLRGYGDMKYRKKLSEELRGLSAKAYGG